MRLLTAISVASLVVSIAAVVFVLGLYAELEKSEAEVPLMNLSEHQVISLVVEIEFSSRVFPRRFASPFRLKKDNQTLNRCQPLANVRFHRPNFFLAIPILLPVNMTSRCFW